jgi:hypothetical protein
MDDLENKNQTLKTAVQEDREAHINRALDALKELILPAIVSVLLQFGKGTYQLFSGKCELVWGLLCLLGTLLSLYLVFIDCCWIVMNWFNKPESAFWCVRPNVIVFCAGFTAVLAICVEIMTW